MYCGSATTGDPVIEAEIRTFGREIARRGIRLIYGGSSRGLMGALADEVLAAGGTVTGVMPKALEGRESAHRGLTELQVVDTMHQREQRMFDLSDAFVAFPGGFGTMVEIIEMITWKQMGIHGKPIIIANIGGFFNPLFQQFEVAIRHQVRAHRGPHPLRRRRDDESDPDVSGRRARDVAQGGGLGLTGRQTPSLNFISSSSLRLIATRSASSAIRNVWNPTTIRTAARISDCTWPPGFSPKK